GGGEHDAERGERVGERGVHFDRLARETLGGLQLRAARRTVLRGQRPPQRDRRQVLVGEAVGRIQGEDLAETCHRRVVLAGVAVRDAERVQRLDVFGRQAFEQ